MAWIKVQEQGHLATSGSDVSGEKTAERTFIAISDTPTTPWAAETASDGVVTIPLPGALLPGSLIVRVQHVGAECEQESPRTHFKVKVEYSNRLGDPPPENPLERDPEISWDFNDYTEKYAEDRTPEEEGGPFVVLNTAYQMFEDFLERDSGSIKCEVTKNIPADAYDQAVAVFYKDVLNLEEFEIDGITVGPGQCKMKSYTAGPRLKENGVAYRVAKWVLEFKESWDDDVESRGYQELTDGTPPQWRDILGEDGKRVDSPWPLDDAGNALDDPTGDPEVLTFKPYFRETFAGWEVIWAYA